MNQKNRFLLYFAIFVSPLGAGVISFPIGGVQMSIFRMVIIILLGRLLIKGRGKVTLWRHSNRFSVLFMLIWLSYAGISRIWAINGGYWIKAVFFIFIGVASMVLFINGFTTREDIKGALSALNFGIAIQALIGWYEIITEDFRFVDKTDKWQMYYNAGFYREPVAMQGNSNDFGLLMFVGTFVALACFYMAYRRITRIVSVILAVNYAVLTILSESRACIIGLIIGLSVYLFIQGVKKILLIAIPVVGILGSPFVMTKLHNILQFNLDATSGSDAIRVGLLKTGFDYSLRTYGFGVGAGQIEAWIETKGSVFYTGNVTNLHNWWIELLAAYGVIVFVGYLVFYLNLFVHNFRIVKSTELKETRALSLSICSILVGFVIASVSSSSNMNSEYLWIFWSICIAYQGLGFCKKKDDCIMKGERSECK